MTLILLCLQQTKDLKCATRLLSKKFEKMSEPKKAIVRELEFGRLVHIPPMNELANSFKLGKNTLKTSYGSFKIKPKIIGDALVSMHQEICFLKKEPTHFRRFQGNTLKQLTDEMMSIGVENEQDRLMFKRIFILYIQMAFLPPSTIIKVSPVHIAPIFEMEKITEGNWGAHVLNFIIKGITNFRLKKKKSIDGCLYALMIIYFHFTKNKEKKGEEKAAVPWVSNWNREQLVARIRAEINGHMVAKQNTFSNLFRLMLMFPLSLSRKKTQRNLQRNNPKGGQKNGIQKEKADFGGFHFRKQK
ncbi:hypothetical protein Ahy_B10g101194 [Arachis hypogaea]|uniref:Aminotransferase-like plant mobile domain-containing protein n=1 Tax=Arachis hypogaea TaxID=3818 RepID=A0A444WYX3_ARAHY|nr:hypothetical protein Ahy_B10g101194 [Arachis hypogaea]